MSFRTLNIGATALVTQKYALDTTGQNIANASTPGYSRQRLQTSANIPEVYSFGALGSGVGVKQVKRIANEFLEDQVRQAKGALEYLDHLQDGYENLEVFFNELTENDLSTSMSEFWDSVSDFASNVEDISTRRSMVEKAASLRDSFRDMEGKIRDLRNRQNDEVVETVNDVNSLLRQIATLNESILKIEAGGATGVTANDLRDQRTELLKELSGLMDVTVTEEPSGSVVVTQRSRMLVYYDRTYELDTKEELSDDLLVDIPVYADDEEEVILGNGKLYGQVYLRDTVLKGFKEDLDQLAASFAWEFNRVHSQGVGLEGFNEVTGTTSVTDPSQGLDNLTFEFTPKNGTYEIENGNFEIILHDTISDEETTINIEIDLDSNTADTDLILFDPLNPTAANALVTKMRNALDDEAPGLFDVEMDVGNHLVMRSNSDQYTFSFGRDTSGVLATLGLNTFFTGYDSGSFNINDTVRTNPDRVAGAVGFTPGDNNGARGLLDLRDTGVLSNDSATLEDFYEGIVGRLGIEAARVDALHETQSDILVRMENQREDLSGVNLDEELTKMIQFQRSYQSAARFISTADVLYETLINM